jgi:hypothetical protein
MSVDRIEIEGNFDEEVGRCFLDARWDDGLVTENQNSAITVIKQSKYHKF